jgi:hypothetical protein
MDPSDLQRRTCMLNTQKYYLDNITDRTIRTPSLELLDDVYNNKQKMPVLKRYNSLSLPKAPRSLARQMSFTLKTSRPKVILYDDIESVIKANYIMIFINTNKIHNDGYLRKLEEYFRINKKEQKPTFVMGHLPITYFRYKGNNKPYFRQMKTEHPLERQSDLDKKKVEELKNNDIIKLYDILSDNNCIYLCADTHCFEIMNIQPKHKTKTLVQIVAGTGGGKPDIVTFDNSDFDNILGNDNDFVSSYTIKGACVNSYGYAKIEVKNSTKINVNYIQVVPHDDKTLAKLQPIQYTYSIIKNNVGKWVYIKPGDNVKLLLEAQIFNPNAYRKDELCQLSTTNVVYNLEGNKPCFEKK